MTTYGVTSDGFVKKDLATILSEINTDGKNQFGEDLNTTTDGVFGVLAGILSDRLSSLWDLAEDTYNSFYPTTSEGTALDGCLELVGVTRLAATATTVPVTVTGTAGTVIPTTFVASVSGDSTKRFVPIAAQTIGVGGTVSFNMQCDSLGATTVLSGTLTVIDTPTLGITSITNTADGTPGRATETDSAARIRRNDSLQVAGTATLDAIRSELLAVTDVDSASVYENITDETDDDNLPPHSIECVVLGGTDQLVGQAILDARSAGINTYGTTTITGVTSDSQDIEVKFTRPSSIDIYLEVDLGTNDLFPSDGLTQSQTAILAYGATLGVGDDVKTWKINAANDDIAGIDTIDIRIATSPSPTLDNNISISNRQIADIDSSRLTIAEV